jgi:hypothetical protein
LNGEHAGGDVDLGAGERSSGTLLRGAGRGGRGRVDGLLGAAEASKVLFPVGLEPAADGRGAGLGGACCPSVRLLGVQR